MARPEPHADLVAALRKPNTFPVKAIEFGAYHYCDDNYHSDSGGSFNGKVREWEDQDQPASDRSYALETPVFSVVLRDLDGILAAALGAKGSTGPFAIGAPAVVKVGAKAVTYDKWYTNYVGVVAGFKKIETNHYKVIIRPNDLALRRTVMHPEWLIGNDWRTAPVENQQLPSPVYFGTYDSSARGGGGAVLLYQVDALIWLLSAGSNEGIDRLYDNGSQMLSTEWSSSVVVRNGRTYHTVTLVDAPEGDITADIRGLTDNGSGGGTLITDPVDQLRYAMVNFVMGEWQSGAWLSATGKPLDTDSFTAAKAYLAKLANGGPKGALQITKQQTGKQLLDSWCLCYGLGAFFEDAGGLALMVEDTTRQDYPTWPWPRPEELELNGASPQPDIDLEGQADRVTLSLPSGLRFAVRDPTAKVGGVPASKDIFMAHARAYL